ncbi:MAG: energy transducer TonB [Bacteroidetes bacterium]|nr:energy transducer TonB [Bacteroidota bacterium]
MDSKKTPKADLENKKIIFRQIGLIVALAVIFLAFEWKTFDKTVEGFGDRISEDVQEEMVEITIQKKQLQPPPPPKKVVVLNLVEDDIEVEDDIQIDVEADQDTEMDEYVPVEVDEEEVEEEAPIFIVVESMPEFPGGIEKLYAYLGANIKYPQMARESGIQGTVYVTFVVERDGSVSDIKVLRGIGGGCDEEAIRVIQSMPKWNPGKQRGKPVRVQYNLPVRFILQ